MSDHASLPATGPVSPWLSATASAREMAEHMKGFVSRLFVLLEDYILPNPVETYLKPWTKMHAVYAKQLRTQVLRVEYCLRCFILFLATQLVETEKGRQSALKAGEKSFRAPPQKRPYDPLIILEGDDKPPAKGRFCMLSGEPESARKSYRHYYPYKPLDWAEIDISKLIARMNRLPTALKHAYRYAAKLAASLLNQDYALSEDEATTPSVSVLDWGDYSGEVVLPGTMGTGFPSGRATYGNTALSATHRMNGSSLEPVSCEPWVRGNQQRYREAGGQNKRKRHSNYCPVFFRQLDAWHPPPELTEHAMDEERSALHILHLRAGEVLRLYAES